MEQPFDFAPESSADAAAPRQAGSGQRWKILIIDDDPEVHDVTRLALAHFDFEGDPVDFLNAYSAAEARDMLVKYPDVALALVDVVMETDHAGLELVRYIRNDLKNRLVRLVLRTGQPGQAPERAVIRDYDINDYKEKTELSAQKLFSTVYASLRSYRDLLTLEANRRGLERVVAASGSISQRQVIDGFIQGVLEQLVAILHLDRDSLFLKFDSVAIEKRGSGMVVIAGTGRYAGMTGRDAMEVVDAATLAVIRESMGRQHQSITDSGAYVGKFCPASGHEDVLYVSSGRRLLEDDVKLIDLFCRNASVAYENLLLVDEIEGTHRDIVYMLGEAIETRSRETGQHVRRVSEYCRLLALLVGLTPREAEILRLAAPLHDFGKIGIPDDILHKQGKLEPHEFEVMRGHAAIGEGLLEKSKREILQAAAIIAGQHHEKWDGSGYPRGLRGEEIHLYGRIGALADVFDALGTRRCYKEPWALDAILAFVREGRATHFDPQLVDVLLQNIDQFEAVRQGAPD